MDDKKEQKEKSILMIGLEQFGNSKSGVEYMINGMILGYLIIPLWLAITILKMFFKIASYFFSPFFNKKKDKEKPFQEAELSLSGKSINNARNHINKEKKEDDSNEVNINNNNNNNKIKKEPPKLYTGAI
jgi:hypothetical protein